MWKGPQILSTQRNLRSQPEIASQRHARHGSDTASPAGHGSIIDKCSWMSERKKLNWENIKLQINIEFWTYHLTFARFNISIQLSTFLTAHILRIFTNSKWLSDNVYSSFKITQKVSESLAFGILSGHKYYCKKFRKPFWTILLSDQSFGI